VLAPSLAEVSPISNSLSLTPDVRVCKAGGS
jgi:hypothetical protein